MNDTLRGRAARTEKRRASPRATEVQERADRESAERVQRIREVKIDPATAPDLSFRP